MAIEISIKVDESMVEILIFLNIIYYPVNVACLASILMNEKK
jgi:hypothetical protein